jgi:flagellar biosynthesis/type III secretory pathway M-ring protein FliF/YscJ
MKIAMTAKDSLYGAEQVAAVTSIAFKEKERENDMLRAKMAYRSTIRFYALLAGLALVMIIALLLFRNFRAERKANTLLMQQKNEIARALSDLKTTQAQLIQSEKMASLENLLQVSPMKYKTR